MPLPRFSHWGEFNERMAAACRRHWDHVAQGHEQTVGQRLEVERPALLALPKCPAPLGRKDSWLVSSLCLVRFDRNDYSVPCEFAYQQAVVEADVAQVRIWAPERIGPQAPWACSGVQPPGTRSRQSSSSAAGMARSPQKTVTSCMSFPLG